MDLHEIYYCIYHIPPERTLTCTETPFSTDTSISVICFLPYIYVAKKIRHVKVLLH